MPSPLQVSSAGLAAALRRLSDANTGFTPLFTTALADAGIEIPEDWILPIDFTANSTNFFQANITPDLIDQGATMTFPLMTLFWRGSRNANLEKFFTFSGPVQFGINFFTTWEAQNPYGNMAAIASAYEAAILSTFNAPAIADWAQQTKMQLVYNGDIQIEQGPILMGGESVLQCYYGTLGMDIHAL
jgi:hypothetical protein